MTLTIETKEDDQRQLTMTVQVSEDQVEQAMRQSARKLGRDIHIPGFRQGKAPYSVILRRVGRDALRADVAEELIQPVFAEAIETSEVEPYGGPSLDNMELEPLIFTFTVPLAPEVELGAYRQIRKEVEPVSVTDEAVEEALEQIRNRHQIVEEVDRAAALDDLVTVSGKGELVAKPADEESEEEAADAAPEVIFEEESIDLLLDSEKLFAGTPFVDNLVGLSVGETKSFNFVFPDDFQSEELGGREAAFEITILNVKNRELPELDDELAKQEGEYETLDDLRVFLRENLEKEALSQAKNDLMEEMTDNLLEDAKMVYPPAAVEAEIDGMMEQFKQQITRSGWTWEDYIKLQGGSDEKMREDFRDSAVKSLERRLVLRQLLVDENLTVEEADVEAAVEERLSGFGDNEDLRKSMGDYFRTGYGFDMISSEILMDKAYSRIKLILAGEAPDLEAAAETGGDEEE